MEVKELKKDTIKSIRINGEVEGLLSEKGYSVQEFLDKCLNEFILIDLKTIKLKKNKE